MNNLPKVVTQQRRGRASNPRLLDRKSDALPLSHREIFVKNRDFSYLRLPLVFDAPSEGSLLEYCDRVGTKKL